MKKTHLVIWLIIFTSASVYSSNIRLQCKTTREYKEVSKLKTVVKSNSSIDQGKTISYNQFIMSNNNFLINIDSSNHTNTVFDFNKETIVTCNYLNHQYSSVPLFYIIHYRISEFQNRNGLAGALQAAGVEDAFGSLFSRESLFGIEDKKDFLKSEIRIIEDKKQNIAKYIYKESTIATIEYSKFSINEKFIKMFEKFLVYNFHLHPVIIEDIIDHGFLPKKIDYSFLNMGTETSVKTEISKFDADEALIKELTDFGKMSADTVQIDTLKNIINKIYDNVLNGNIVLIDRQQCIDQSVELIKEEKYLDALLSLMEYLLQSDDKPTDAIQNSISFAVKDTNMQIFLHCLQSKIPSEDKISQLTSIPQERYDKGYIINIFIANYNNNIDSKKSFEYFKKTLLKNPFITGVYKDLGESYSNKYDMETAWKCYDIAMQINEHHSMSKSIESLKTKLKTDFPLYFLDKN